MKKLVLLAIATLIVAQPAFAAEGAAASGLGVLGGGLAIAIAALGGALGQGKAISAALEAIGRNPSASGKIFTPFIIGMVLIESLVILSFVVANKYF